MNISKKYIRRLAAVLTVVFIMTMGAGALAASFQAKINSSSAKVYRTPSTSGGYVKNGKGITVTVTGYSGSWARVRYKGVTGYTKVSNLDLKNRLKAYTAKSSTPVYKSASSSSRKMGNLSIGRAVYVVGKSGNYFRVQNSSGSVTGYIYEKNLTTKAKLTAAYKAYKKAQQSSGSASSGSSSGSTSTGNSSSGSSSSGTATTPTSKIDKILAKALSLVGKPYKSSDNPPSSFNCSSFVEYCFEYYGYTVEGTAVKQAADGRFTKINYNGDTGVLKKGDILCFDTNGDGTCDHTAIYLGSQKFVEASETAGKVWTNDLDRYYKSYLMHARRPK